MGTTNTPLNETHTLKTMKRCKIKIKASGNKKCLCIDFTANSPEYLWGINCNSKMCIIKTSTV